jgi:4-amino-4-deoxy-L-arabinose transferase-like glycosyltransferase
MQAPERRVDWLGYGCVTVLFAAARLLYAYLGLHFDASTFPGYMQFIDRELLAKRLLESLWYYHANPPLLNLFAGVGIKLFGANADVFFAVCFHALGLILAWCVYLLTARLSGSRLAAGIASALLVFSPSFVLYENWFMYSLPAAVLLTLAAVLLYRYVRSGTTRSAAAFFAVLAALLLLRSLFHLAWLVAVALLLVAAQWQNRKQILIAAALPILVVALWYGKNLYLFGTFSSSTWFGLGLSNITTLTVTRDELRPLVERGELSQFALVSRYKHAGVFFSGALPPTGIAVLDQVKKSSGELNWNYQQLIPINRYYTADGIKVARRFPASYVTGLIISNRLFFSPSSMNLYFIAANRLAAQPIEALYNPLLYGADVHPRVIQSPHFGFKGDFYLEVNGSVRLFVAWWLLLGYAYVQARGAFLRRPGEDRPRAIAIGFAAFSMLYIYGVGTAFELAENYRYRWVVEPLTFVLAATAITHLLRALLKRFATVRASRVPS